MRETIRNAALVLCLLAVAALSYSEYVAPRGRMPTWIEIQEGPVAHGVDKFYRNVYMKGDLEVADDLLTHGNTDLGTNLGITGTLALNEATGTITATQTLTPSATFYQLDPSAEITVTLAPCNSAGQMLILYNDDAQTVNIADSDLLPSGAFTMTQHDIFVGLCDGADWLKMHLQNN